VTKEKDITQHLNVLKSALTSLKPSGTDGFEGFIRIVLTELTGIPFRLAASGLQGGIDGDALFPKDAVSFEAKRYSESTLNRNDVLTKIADFARNGVVADRLWVLAATTEVSTQLSGAVRHDCTQQAIFPLILDWCEYPLPLLAVAAVAAGSPAIDFMIANGDAELSRDEIDGIFNLISKHPHFYSLLTKLKDELDVSQLATARSVECNQKWREQCFRDNQTSKIRLGQSLGIAACEEMPTMRSAVQQTIRESLIAGTVTVLIGDEGRGKSWLAAQICYEHQGISLFISAEAFNEIKANDVDEFIIKQLIQQTNDLPSLTLEQTWRHRINFWKEQPSCQPLLVIVDGINQRHNLRWSRLLNHLNEFLKSIQGRLLITARPLFWQEIVARGISFEPKKIDIPEWTDEERDKLLIYYGINIYWLDTTTLQTLKNPRLLGVAVNTLPHHDSYAWKGLTTDRLLFEHLRMSQRECFEEQTVKELTSRLSNIAKQVLAKVREDGELLPEHFESESEAVIETRFFKTLPGLDGHYELRSEGLPLALAYAVINQLLQAHRRKQSLHEHLAHLIEPIRAMDRTVDVVFAAMMVCALDDLDTEFVIFDLLLDAFSDLQNVNDRRYEEFISLVEKRPKSLFKALRQFLLESRHRLNRDWFIHAAFEFSATEHGSLVVKEVIHSWLHLYNDDAVEQMDRFPVTNQEEHTKRVQTRGEEILKIRSCLSDYEQSILATMSKVSGEVDQLYECALELLAGHSIAEFTDSFIALGYGFSFDNRVWSSKKAFQQLTMFNRADPSEMRESFINNVIPLRSEGTSNAGLWTLVRMLYASGDYNAAEEASEIADKLRNTNELYEFPAENHWRRCLVANPDVMVPSDLVETLQKFREIPTDKLMQDIWAASEDSFFKDFLPVVCKFRQTDAIEKARSLIFSLLTREGFPLRQLMLNGREYSILIDREFALKLKEYVTQTRMSDVLWKEDQNTQRMFLFEYIAPFLTSEEQLDCMIDPAFGTGYLLSVIPNIKQQSEQTIINVLVTAIRQNNEQAIYGTLTAARFGNVSISNELESQILECLNFDSSRVRAICFELAHFKKLRSIILTVAHSSWNWKDATENTHEDWFGSLLLVQASALGEIEIDAMLQRVKPRVWFNAVKLIGEDISHLLAKMFLHRIQNSIQESKSLSFPDIDFELSGNEIDRLPLLDIKESNRSEGRFHPHKSLSDSMKGFTDYQSKRERLREISSSFLKGLEGFDSRIFFEWITIDNLKTLTDFVPDLLSELVGKLVLVSEKEFTLLKNIALAAGNLVSGEKPELAVQLFQRAMDSGNFVSHGYGDGLTLEHKAIWSAVPSLSMYSLWKKRILRALNDDELAKEVLAAERYGAKQFIYDYVMELKSSRLALDRAYAITIVGFSRELKQFSDLIETHLNEEGISGYAAKKAKIALDLALWAEGWVQDMWNSESQDEFFCRLVIAKTCIDARIEPKPLESTAWKHFAPIFWRARDSVIKKQTESRKKTLLGQEAPEKIFLIGYR
jgi:hypothetical protein